MISALPRVGKVDKGEWTKAFKQVWILAGGDAWKYSEETWGGAQRSKPKPKKSIELLYTKATPMAWLSYVAGYIDGVGGDNITEITATTQDKVKNAIFAGMEREEGIPQIADRVAGVYDGFEGYRATMIARSEVVDASNQASMAQAREAGSTLDLMWIATNDDRTREEHAEMDGVTVAYDQEFDCADGTTMPGEAVNCRCTIGYAIPSEPVAEGISEENAYTDYQEGANVFNWEELPTAQRDAYAGYIGTPDYENWNAGLRGLQSLSDEDKAGIKALNEMIDAAPKYEGIAYRGAQVEPNSSYYTELASWRKDDVITFKGFTSTSASKDIAMRFTEPEYMTDNAEGFLFEIHGKNGAILATEEQEVLFHESTSFIVKSGKTLPNGLKYIVLQEL